MEEFAIHYQQLKKAIERLEESLSVPATSMVRDSAIQRFEFCMDLAWKTVKVYLQKEKGVVVASPKDAFRQAFRQKLIEYEDDWITYVDMRNETVHTYNEKTAEEIYKDLPAVLIRLKELLSAFSIDAKMETA